MTRIDVRSMTTEELVNRFILIALDQDVAIRHDDNATCKRRFDQMDKIKEELRSRPGGQRRALVSLFEHPNIQVPDDARRVLQIITDSRGYPQAGDAGMPLDALDRGIFEPT
jgi:hypothetical protein